MPIGLSEARLGEVLWQNEHTVVGKECHQAFGEVHLNCSITVQGFLENGKKVVLGKCFRMTLWIAGALGSVMELGIRGNRLGMRQYGGTQVQFTKR